MHFPASGSVVGVGALVTAIVGLGVRLALGVGDVVVLGVTTWIIEVVGVTTTSIGIGSLSFIEFFTVSADSKPNIRIKFTRPRINIFFIVFI
jgi:hypothetical protein